VRVVIIAALHLLLLMHTLSDALDHSLTADALFATADAPFTFTNADNSTSS
jgi:hypothetical protein